VSILINKYTYFFKKKKEKKKEKREGKGVPMGVAARHP
jgi:hypothetical protein